VGRHGFFSIARLSVIVIFAAFTGLPALMLVPALASLISNRQESRRRILRSATAQNLRDLP
jgi:hypothetical protein